MHLKEIVDQAREVSRRYRVTSEKGFHLKDYDPGDTWKWKSDYKAKAEETLQAGIHALARLQDMLYAQDHWAVLLIFQAMDAAGKDGAIKHVMSGLNPQGCQVYSFKAPSAEEQDHDFLWRCLRVLPNRGCIGIFNRSYYEETLVVRVHSELLAMEKLPPSLVTKKIWKERFQDIRGLERYLGRNGVVVRKFFLNVSKREQKRRFLDRINKPDKNWKFSAGDVEERKHWEAYMDCYGEAIQKTATKEAPWYVVPADNKWFTRLVVASALIDTLDSLDLAYPEVSKEKVEELKESKKALTRK